LAAMASLLVTSLHLSFPAALPSNKVGNWHCVTRISKQFSSDLVEARIARIAKASSKY